MRQHISYAVDYRAPLSEDGDLTKKDEVGDPTIIFRGATTRLLHSVFSFLVPPGGNGVAREWKLKPEHDVKYRNGRGYRRYAVTLSGYNARFCSMEDLFMLIESVAHKYCDCEIKHLTLSEFLNV